MDPATIALLVKLGIELAPVIIKGGIDVWNVVDPSDRARLAKAFGDQLDKFPGLLNKIGEYESVDLESLKLTRSGEDAFLETDIDNDTD